MSNKFIAIILVYHFDRVLYF